MKVPTIIAAAVVGIIVSLQTWTLSEVVALKVAVAKLEARLDASHIARGARTAESASPWPAQLSSLTPQH